MPAFAGFVPATNPRFVIVVMVDEPAAGAHQGGSVSAPIFNMIAQIALGDFAVPPDAKGFRDALVALSNRYESKAAEDDANEENGANGIGGQNLPENLPKNVVAQTQPGQTPANKQNALPKPGTGVMVSQNISPNAVEKPKPKASPTPQPKVDMLAASSGMMPDLRGKGVRSVVQACTQLSLTVKLSGSGVVIKQWPSPGARVRPGEDCKVEFQ